jgi:hypothetical protein
MHIVDVEPQVDVRRAGELVGWSKTRSSDTRVSVLLPEGASTDGTEVAKLRSIGAGLYVTNGGVVLS